MNQAQPVRTGDVYPPTAAAKRDASHERDKIIEQGQQRGGDDLHVEQTDLTAGRRMVTASAGGQVMAQFTVPVPAGREVADDATDAVTLGEALEAAAQTAAGDKPVDLADAAAVQAAETRATGLGGNVRGSVAAAAQRAAEANARRARDGGEKVTLRDVVVSSGAAGTAMPADNKAATREDAQMVAAAAARNAGKGARAGGGGGIADAVLAAADMNEERMM